MISSSREWEIPNYDRDGYQELTIPNHAKNFPLAGNMYVDFFNHRGGYKIKFDVLTAAEYANLRLIYNDQFNNEEFLTFDRTGLSGDLESVFFEPAGRVQCCLG